MVNWPKLETEIAYMSLGNPSLRATRERSKDLFKTIALYQKKILNKSQDKQVSSNLFVRTLLSQFEYTTSTIGEYKAPLLPPVAFRGTRRQIMEKEITNLNQLKNEFYRIYKHIVFGPLLKFWRRFINHNFPTL